jgi:hypothetical protein
LPEWSDAVPLCIEAEGGSGTGFHPPRLVGFSLPPGRSEARTDVDQLFPRGRRIEHSDMRNVPRDDKLLNHGTRICIPRNVEMLGKSCFAGDYTKANSLESIIFESDSRLTRIEDSCFKCCSLKSMCIPRNVEMLGKLCFAGDYEKFNSLESITFENDSRLIRIEDSCFQQCSLKSINIPRNVEILGKLCFAGHYGKFNSLESITFENESRLTRIEDWCFWCCSLKSICIPRNVEILGKSCFAGDYDKFHSLELITFENDSRLTRIEDSCFQKCSLKSICIPRNVEILGKSCFADDFMKANSLESITFENDSRLTRIEDSCFWCCPLKSICIPRNVEILGKSCFAGDY